MTIEERIWDAAIRRMGGDSIYALGYRDGATEQEEEMTKEMAKLNEEWRENLQYQETHPTDKTIRLILNSLGYEEESWIDFVKERIKAMEEQQ